MAADGWLIYALGGGWGHLNRSLALARKAVADRPITLITNSPYVTAIAAELGNIQCHPIAADAEKPAVVTAVRQRLQQFTGTCLIVDTFPRGIAGELVDLLPRFNGYKVLVHRDIRPDYFEKYEIESFVQHNYDLILIPGAAENPPLAQSPKAITTAPWLIRSAEECAIVDWRSAAAKPHILVVVTGQESERSHFTQVIQALLQHFPEADIRYLTDRAIPGVSPALWLKHYPGMECLAVADLVIGAAGYNLVYETQAIGVPLIAFAFSRQYDRQAKRATQAISVNTIDEMVNAVCRILPQCKPRQLLAYQNGVEQAVELIERGVVR